MLSVRRPSDAEIEAFLRSQKSVPFSYAAIGATAGVMPPGYTVDRNRAQLGIGHPLGRALQKRFARDSLDAMRHTASSLG